MFFYYRNLGFVRFITKFSLILLDFSSVDAFSKFGSVFNKIMVLKLLEFDYMVLVR